MLPVPTPFLYSQWRLHPHTRIVGALATASVESAQAHHCMQTKHHLLLRIVGITLRCITVGMPLLELPNLGCYTNTRVFGCWCRPAESGTDPSEVEVGITLSLLPAF